MSDYVPGEMDISQQKRAFAGFIRVGIWLAVATAVTLIFLAIFAT
ncbi:aa3-type cytochrome c oxidase subunit IV [Pikeienuella piscinae]|uniref:Aa3-type cytochrome c oxidase subunit IV n=1 Tax=Pikeienuella piscinae TaxID=2748098 RepID=A0A7M3T654_9RHOB|nr:aa3-type cytochrome c oxidase subunit IV [Pikeienuella piscinae]QIE57485.1 aa3-type cytochrome c oxidase subunit IV [Pikeienuella piscinae]